MMHRYIGYALLLFLGNYSMVLAQEPFKLFFGLLHSHTSFSDGVGTPGEAYQHAQAAGLDFFAITEHNHNQAGGDDGTFLTPSTYQELQLAAGQHTHNGAFVALFGQEVSSISKGNHVNVFNATTICDIANGDFKDFYERWLPAHPEVPIVQLNHPDVSADQSPTTAVKERHNDYGIDDYQQDFPALVHAAGKYVGLIELIVGPAFSEAQDRPHHEGTHESDYLFYLNQGFRVAPSVGQDNHKRTWGVATHARLGVWATDLSTNAVYEALKARRTYASEDENIRVQFTINTAWMGAEVAVAAVLYLQATDNSRGSQSGTIVSFHHRERPLMLEDTVELNKGT